MKRICCRHLLVVFVAQTPSERYAKGTGRDLSDINYYRAFSHWRWPPSIKVVYKRYLVVLWAKVTT